MLKHRLISGFSMGGALLAMMFFAPAGLAGAVLIAVCALAHVEFYALIKRGGTPVYRNLGTLCGCAVVTVTFLSLCPAGADTGPLHAWEAIIAVVALIAIFVRQFPEKDSETPLQSISYTLLGVFYVGFLMNFITRLGFQWDSAGFGQRISDTGRELVLFLIVVVKFSDIGAFFVGSRFGRHKMFPRVSPKKTWEGFGGGVVFSILSGAVVLWLTGGTLGSIRVEPVHAIILPVLLAIAGVTGDMFESLIKRSTGQKDSSAAIPGMGGLLDVLDSLLFGAPLLYAYVQFFLT